MTRLEVVREEADGLSRRCWRFAVLSFPQFHLDEYAEQARKTRRHRKWETHRMYTRTGSTREWGVDFLKEEPDVPDDVLEEATARFREMVEFRRWRRR